MPWWSMSSAFWEHQLLPCPSIKQCMMLNADVRKGGWSTADRGRGRKGFFYGQPLWMTPYKKFNITMVNLGQMPCSITLANKLALRFALVLCWNISFTGYDLRNITTVLSLEPRCFFTVTINVPSYFFKSVCAQNFRCATFYQYSSIFRTTCKICSKLIFYRKIYVRSKFSCVSSSHDLCACAHAHSLEGTLVTMPEQCLCRR